MRAALVDAWLVVLMVLVIVGAVGIPSGCAGGQEETGPGGSLPSGGRAVSFSAADGVELSGSLFGEGDRGVVLLHMYPADQTSWFAIAERLAGDGYLVLTLDFRGYGGSSGQKDIGLIGLDVEAAVSEIERQGATAVALVGASMGGTAALMAADMATARGAPVAGVATLSAPVEFKGLSAADAVVRVTEPKLFLGTEGDSGGEAAQELYQRAAEPREVEVYRGSEHGTDMLEGSEGAAVAARLERWLAAVLGEPGDGGG